MDGYACPFRQISAVPRFDANSFDLIHRPPRTSEPSLVLSRVQIHPVYIGAADRRRFPVAFYSSKYRLALRATLLVWPRTSLLIISRGLSIRSSSSLSSYHLLLSVLPPSLRRETHPLYIRRFTRRARANP